MPKQNDHGSWGNRLINCTAAPTRRNKHNWAEWTFTALTFHSASCLSMYSAYQAHTLRASHFYGKVRITALVGKTTTEMLQGVIFKDNFSKSGRAKPVSVMVETGDYEQGRSEIFLVVWSNYDCLVCYGPVVCKSIFQISECTKQFRTILLVLHIWCCKTLSWRWTVLCSLLCHFRWEQEEH